MHCAGLVLRKSPRIIANYRNISSFTNILRQNEKTTESFIPVYKFPYIVPFSIVNKLKIYHTVITVVSIPGSLILNQLNYISSEAVEFTASLGISGCLTLYSLGYLTDKFIGYVYYNEEKDVAKISYINFWGKRKDIEIPTEDLVRLSDLPVAPFDGLFLTIRRYSTKETLRLNLRYGIILDKEKIKKVF